jgi:hypothetical protein
MPACLTYSAVRYASEEKATHAASVFVLGNVLPGLVIGGVAAAQAPREERPGAVLGGMTVVSAMDLMVGGSLFIVAKLFRGLGELDR